MPKTKAKINTTQQPQPTTTVESSIPNTRKPATIATTLATERRLDTTPATTEMKLHTTTINKPTTPIKVTTKRPAKTVILKTTEKTTSFRSTVPITTPIVTITTTETMDRTSPESPKPIPTNLVTEGKNKKSKH